MENDTRCSVVTIAQRQQKARANSGPATNNNKKPKCQALNAMRSPIRNLWTLNNNAMHKEYDSNNNNNSNSSIGDDNDNRGDN